MVNAAFLKTENVASAVNDLHAVDLFGKEVICFVHSQHNFAELSVALASQIVASYLSSFSASKECSLSLQRPACVYVLRTESRDVCN